MPPGASTRAISAHHVVTGWRLVTRSKDPAEKGSASRPGSMATTHPPSRAQPVGRDRDVRRVALGRHQERRQARQSGEELTAAALEVEHAGRAGRPFHHPLPVAPARSLLGGPTVEPAEVPPADRRRGRVGDQRRRTTGPGSRLPTLRGSTPPFLRSSLCEKSASTGIRSGGSADHDDMTLQSSSSTSRGRPLARRRRCSTAMSVSGSANRRRTSSLEPSPLGEEPAERQQRVGGRLGVDDAGAPSWVVER